MTARDSLRTSASRIWRALWPAVVVAGGAITCDAPTAPFVRNVRLNVVPVYSVNMALFSGMSVDKIRLTAVKPPAETLATQDYAFPASQDTAAVNFEVPVSGTETLTVYIELLAGAQVMFRGSEQAVASPGSTTGGSQPIPVTYQGPGTNIGRLMIAPRDSGAAFGATFVLRTSAFDSSNNAVGTYYLHWRDNAPANGASGVDANGTFHAGNARSTIMVWAETPTGIKDSTTVTVAPVPNALAISGGNGQSAAPGSVLPTLLSVRVTAQDNGPVVGVPVTFAAVSGGGSITPPNVVSTDVNGVATAQATLGPSAGTHTFSASAPGLPTATFSETASGPPPTPTIAMSLVGGGALVPQGGTAALIVTLSQAAAAGGVNVSLTSDSTSYLLFGTQPTATASIAAGQTKDTVQVNGNAQNVGVARIRAVATGFTPDTAFFVVSPSFITFNPPTVSVGVGANTNVQVVLSTPAPAGGVPVTLSSTDAAIMTVPASVTVAQTQTTANVQVHGVAAGQAGILATAANYAQGGAVVTVGVGPASISKTAGDGLTAFINDTTATRPQVQVLDGSGAPVPNVAVNFVITSGGGSMPVTTVNTNASGIATAGAAWKMGSTPGANQLTAQVPSAPSVLTVFSATAVPPPPVIQLSIFGSTVVGQARTGQLDVKLLQPAPAAGVTVNLATRRAGLLRIGSYTSENGSVSFAQGDTLKSITVFGDSSVTGIDTVIATGTGYTPDTLAVPISLNLISLPPTLNVPLSQNVSLPINLSVAAPAGGLKVAISSNNPAVTVVTDTVIVPAGSQLANATVTGTSLGSATVTATNPNYAPDASTVTVAASLNITVTSLSPNQSFGLPITIQLETGGTPVAAPAGGVPVTFTSLNATCATAANTTIPAGLNQVVAQVSYGGSATTPCTTSLIASGPAGFKADTVTVNMQAKPALFAGNTFIGSDLERAVGVSMGASNHGGTTIHVASSNPSVLVSLTDSTAGAASVDVPVPVNGSSANYYIQGAPGLTNDSSDIVVTAPGFVPDTSRVNVFQPVADIIFLSSTGNTRTANDQFQVRIGSPTSVNGTISAEDVIRPGGTPVTFTVINDTLPVADLVTQAKTGDTVTVSIGVRQSRSPASVPTGGVDFDYTAAGITTVHASAPGYRSVTSAISQTITVTAPVVSLSPTYIGAHLQRAVGNSLSAVAVTGDTVTLRTTRPGVLLISPNDSTGFADSIQVPLIAGQSSFNYYIQGVDSILNDSTDVIATLPQFTPDTARMHVFQPVVDIIFLPGSGTTRSANDPFQVRIGSPSSFGGTISSEDVLRFGHAPVTFDVINDSAVVADLVTLALTGDSVQTQITARQSRSGVNVASGGLDFDFVNGGVTTVRSHGPGFRSTGTALGQQVTVSAPVITIGNTYIGASLQRAVGASLGASAIAGDTVILKTARPGVIRISPNDSTGFADSIKVGIPLNASSFNYYIQGVDGVSADSVDVIATMTGFTPDTARYSVFAPVYDIIFLNATANALASNDPFQVRIGSATSPTANLSSEDVLRFGAAPITASLHSSQATVAQLIGQSTQGSDVSVSIAARQSRSPTSVATGGVEIDYLTTGSTVISASIPGFRTTANPADTQVVTVTAPFVTANNVTTASGLQVGTSFSVSSANHGDLQVVIKSANPAIMLVSPDDSTPGTDSIVVTLLANQTSKAFYVQGVEGQTAPGIGLTVRAPGFTDGSASATVLQPAVDVIFLSATGTAATTNDDFNVRLGYANSPSNTSMQAELAVRAGGPGPLTVTIASDNPGAGLLTTQSQTSQPSVTVQIPPRASRSGTTLATGGVQFDFVAAGTVFVAPSIPGFITVQQTVAGTPGFRVVIN